MLFPYCAVKSAVLLVQTLPCPCRSKHTGRVAGPSPWSLGTSILLRRVPAAAPAPKSPAPVIPPSSIPAPRSIYVKRLPLPGRCPVSLPLPAALCRPVPLPLSCTVTQARAPVTRGWGPLPVCAAVEGARLALAVGQQPVSPKVSVSSCSTQNAQPQHQQTSNDVHHSVARHCAQVTVPANPRCGISSHGMAASKPRVTAFADLVLAVLPSAA
jgi:hypothetical protein